MSQAPGPSALDTDARSAFESVLCETQERIRAYIGSLGVPITDIDDVAQEVYLDWWRRPQHPPEVPILVWLHGMARNCALEYFRRRSRHGKLLARIALHLDAVPGMDHPPPAVGQDAEALLHHLRDCLERLEASQRSLVEAHYHDGLPISQLALQRERSADALHMQLLRIRTLLKRCVEQRGLQQA